MKVANSSRWKDNVEGLLVGIFLTFKSCPDHLSKIFGSSRMASYLQQHANRFFEKIMLRNFFNHTSMTEPIDVLYVSTGVSAKV